MKNLTFLFLLLPVFSMADVVVPVDKVENSVNIRLDADATSDVVGELRRGEALPLVSSIEGWHEVQLEGDATGFVSSDWSRVKTDVVEEETVVELIEEDIEVVVEVVVEDAVVEAVDETVAEEVEDIVVEFVEEVVEEVAEEPAPVAVPEPVVEVEVEVEAVVEEEILVDPVPEPAAIPAPDIKAARDYVVKIRKEGVLEQSQIFDNGNMVGIATTDPKQRLEVNGSIQIHDQNSNVAGLMITQADGDTGYIMHNRASTLTIGSGSIDRITIDRDGNVGIGASRPEYPLEMASGAHVTAGGVWTNRSSRESKENIAALSSKEATAAVMALQPVSFNYTAEQGEGYVGFIAEDVPALLASSDRESLSTMDVVAALTKVVQEQQRRIEELEARIEE